MPNYVMQANSLSLYIAPTTLGTNKPILRLKKIDKCSCDW